MTAHEWCGHEVADDEAGFYRGAFGVYALVHRPTGLRYIGQSWDLEARRASHLASVKIGHHPHPRVHELIGMSQSSDWVFVVLAVSSTWALFAAEARAIKQAGEAALNDAGDPDRLVPDTPEMRRRAILLAAMLHTGKRTRWISRELWAAGKRPMARAVSGFASGAKAMHAWQLEEILTLVGLPCDWEADEEFRRFAVAESEARKKFANFASLPPPRRPAGPAASQERAPRTARPRPAPKPYKPKPRTVPPGVKPTIFVGRRAMPIDRGGSP